MLIAKKPAANDVVAFKLSTNQEVVGKMVSLTADEIVIAKPVVVELHGLQGGQAGIGFAPYSLAADDAGQFTYNRNHVISEPVPARSDIAAAYLKATTGLEIASGSSLQV
jgi:hypothetical protein